MCKKKNIYDIEFLPLLIPTIYWIYVGKQNEKPLQQLVQAIPLLHIMWYRDRLQAINQALMDSLYKINRSFCVYGYILIIFFLSWTFAF